MENESKYGEDYSNVSLSAIDNMLSNFDEIIKDKSLGLSEAMIKEGRELYTALFMAKLNKIYLTEPEKIHGILVLAEDFCKRANALNEVNPFKHHTPSK